MPRGIRLIPLAGIAICAFLAFTSSNGTPVSSTPNSTGDNLDTIAETYVKLVLSLGENDPNCVDAYFGPEDWRVQVLSEGLDLHEIDAGVSALIEEMDRVDTKDLAGNSAQRHVFLLRHIRALGSRTQILLGKPMSFDEEARALYDITPATCTNSEIQTALDALDSVLPGEGGLLERYENFIADFYVPPEKFEAVMETAIRECRDRTISHIDLPEGENIDFVFISGVSWTGYSEYLGDYRSRIHINTDIPFLVDRFIHFAVHEAYPGHHVQGVLLDHYCLHQKGWSEFYVIPTYAPIITTMEGCAEYGIRLVFPGDDYDWFVASLFDVAGLDSDRADEFLKVRSLVKKCLNLGGGIWQDRSCAGIAVIRRYADGEVNTDEAIDWLGRYALVSPASAKKALAFADEYGSYIGIYDASCKLIEEYMESQVKSSESESKKWQVLCDLYSTPLLPSTMRSK